MLTRSAVTISLPRILTFKILGFKAFAEFDDVDVCVDVNISIDVDVHIDVDTFNCDALAARVKSRILTHRTFLQLIDAITKHTLGMGHMR